jgi:hypothetical protein
VPVNFGPNLLRASAAERRALGCKADTLEPSEVRRAGARSRAARARLSCHMPSVPHLGAHGGLVSLGRASPGSARGVWVPPRGWCVRAVARPVLLPARASDHAATAASARCWRSQARTCFLGAALALRPAPPHPPWGRSSRKRTLARPPRPALSKWGSKAT